MRLTPEVFHSLVHHNKPEQNISAQPCHLSIQSQKLVTLHISPHLRTVVNLSGSCRRCHQCDDITVNGFIRGWSKCVCYDSQETREALLHLLRGLRGAFNLKAVKVGSHVTVCV